MISAFVSTSQPKPHRSQEELESQDRFGGQRSSTTNQDACQRTILFAEDEDIIRDLTVRILERAGYSVLAAPDGQEAKEIFESRGEEIDLALLDVVMPRMDGHQLYEFIRESQPTTPVLFCTGYSLNSVYTRFIKDEGLDVLRKPYPPSVLLEKIQGILGKASLGTS